MSLRTIVVGIAIPLGLLACSSSPTTEDVKNGSAALSSITGQIKSYDGFCFDVFADRQTTGAAVDIATCNGTAAQTFIFTPGGPGPIRNAASGLCLDDVLGGGAVLQMVTCNGSPEQTWTISGAEPRSSKIVNGYGHCMDVLYDHQVSGQTVDPTICNGTNAQVWGYVLPCGPGQVNDANGNCTCDRTNYDVSVSSALFTDLVAYQLSTLRIDITNNVLTVTLPSSLHVTPPPPTTLSGVTVSSLDMPSTYLPSPGSWVWSVSTSSAALDVSTTLSASLSGSWSGVDGIGGCGMSANIYSAPVNIVMTSQGASALEVQSVSVPLSALVKGNGNTTTSGCSLLPEDDKLGQIESQIESSLKTQLNDSVFMGQLLNGVVQAMASADPDALNLPKPLPPGSTWGCGEAALTTGAITGVCERQCQ